MATTATTSGFTRIKKHQALFNFKAGKTVYLTTDDVTPAELGRVPASIRPTPESFTASDAVWFCRAVEMFKHFNCGAPAGTGVAYYQAN